MCHECDINVTNQGEITMLKTCANFGQLRQRRAVRMCNNISTCFIIKGHSDDIGFDVATSCN